MSKYCGDCEHLSISERSQLNKKDIHECKLFNSRVLHFGEHPFLPRLPKCLAKGKELVQQLQQEKLEIKMCKQCGIFPADSPSENCVGCDSYSEHF